MGIKEREEKVMERREKDGIYMCMDRIGEAARLHIIPHFNLISIYCCH